VSIVDVAPLLLHQLDLPVPGDMAGRVPLDMFEPEELGRRPPRVVAVGRARPAPEPQAAAAALEPEEQAALMQRLRALGYVE
jgi:hypothetical protein